MLPLAIALFVLAATVGQTSGVCGGLVPSAAQLLGKGPAFAAATLLFPAGLATLDRLCGLWRHRDTGRPGQAPEIP